MDATPLVDTNSPEVEILENHNRENENLCLAFHVNKITPPSSRQKESDQSSEQVCCSSQLLNAAISKNDKMILRRQGKRGFGEGIQSYLLSERVARLSEETYRGSELLESLQASAQETITLLRRWSRPKKKNVSIHSVLSFVWVAMFLLALIPQFSPTLHNEMGLPQIFDIYDLSPSAITNYRICQFSVMLISVLGNFRVPKNAPQCRKVFFTAITWIAIMFWTFGDSNIAGGISSGYTFDIFSAPGAFFVTAAQLAGSHFILLLVDDAICGPNKGRDTIPVFTNRWTASFSGTLFYALACLQLVPTLAVVLDPVGFQVHGQAFWEAGFQHLGLTTGFGVNAFVAFGSYFGTLVLQRDTTQWAGSIFCLVLAVLLMFDGLSFFFMPQDSTSHQAMADVLAWVWQTTSTYHLDVAVISAWLGTILNAFGKRQALIASDPSKPKQSATVTAPVTISFPP